MCLRKTNLIYSQNYVKNYVNNIIIGGYLYNPESCQNHSPALQQDVAINAVGNGS